MPGKTAAEPLTLFVVMELPCILSCALSLLFAGMLGERCMPQAIRQPRAAEPAAAPAQSSAALLLAAEPEPGGAACALVEQRGDGGATRQPGPGGGVAVCTDVRTAYDPSGALRSVCAVAGGSHGEADLTTLCLTSQCGQEPGIWGLGAAQPLLLRRQRRLPGNFAAVLPSLTLQAQHAMSVEHRA